MNFLTGNDRRRRKQPVSPHDAVVDDDGKFRRVSETGPRTIGRRERSDRALRRLLALPPRVEQVQERSKIVTVGIFVTQPLILPPVGRKTSKES